MASSLESLLPELAAVIPTRFPIDVSPTLTITLEHISSALQTIARALERAYPDPYDVPANLRFLIVRDDAWVVENLRDEGRLMSALYAAMQAPGPRQEAPYNNLYDVWKKGASYFVTQRGLARKSMFRMCELFFNWGLDGDNWRRR